MSSARSPCKTSCFQVRLWVTFICSRSVVCRLWRQVSNSIDCVMLLGYQSTILWNLSTNSLIDSPFFCFVARRVDKYTLVSSSRNRARKSFSRSTHFLIEPAWSFMNYSKVTLWGYQWINEPWWHCFILHSLFGIWSSIYVDSVTPYHRRPLQKRRESRVLTQKCRSRVFCLRRDADLALLSVASVRWNTSLAF